jgi:exopolysaccharide production protein ExoQ
VIAPMREVPFSSANSSRDGDPWSKVLSFNPRTLGRRLLFVGILFLFSGTHNVLTILSPGGATVDANASADVTVGGVAESDSIPGPLKTLVWCVVGGVLAASQTGRVLKLVRQFPLLTGLGLLGLVSSLWSVLPPESFQHGTFLLLSTLLAYFFTVEYGPDDQMQIVIVIGWIAVLASTAVAVFLPQYGVDQVYNLGEWRGIYAQKNACAAAMLLFLAPLFARRSGLPNTSTALYGLSVLFVLVKTQSRNGWVVAVALIASMMLLNWLARFKKKDRIALFTMGAWFVGGCVWTLVVSSGEILSMMGRDPTFTGRTGIWDAAIRAIGDRPVLGYGFRAFWSGPNGASTVLYGVATTKHAHNGLLELALSLGLVGVIIFLASFLMALWDIATCLRPDRPGFVDWYIGTILAVAYFSVAEPFLVLDKSLSWVLYVVACVGLRQQAQRLRDREHGAGALALSETSFAVRTA